VPAQHTATVALRDGRLLGSQQAGEVRFYEESTADLLSSVSRNLRRVDSAVITE